MRTLGKRVAAMMVVWALCVGTAPARAQHAQQSAEDTAVPLKVDVVLSRYQGEARVSSVPYTVFVNQLGRRAERSSLRVGMDIATGEQETTTTDKSTVTRPVTRWVGTEIDCGTDPAMADRLPPGVFRIAVSIRDSSVYTPEGAARSADPVAFRSFAVSNNLLLSDRQAMEFSVGTDKITGETVKATVTLTVVR
jgi:hypothetical protein